MVEGREGGNPWGVRWGAGGGASYEIWVTEDGGLDDSLSAKEMRGVTRAALRAAAERFQAGRTSGELARLTAVVRVHVGPDDEGVGEGPASAPSHLQRPLSELLAETLRRL